MTKNMLMIVNPNAGKGEIRGRLLEVLELFCQAQYQVTVYVTQAPGEASQAARQGEAYDLVVCSGGDGTLNETIAGLMELEHRPTLGYIPAGTVNDFASSLGIPKQIPQAALAIVGGRPRSCDVGRFNRRWFTYVAAFGAFTDVSYQTPQQFKNVLGRSAYLLEGIRGIPNIKPHSLILRTEDQEVEGDFIFGMISNSLSVGGFKLGEHSDVSMDDGLLEVTLIRRPQSAAELQRIINAALLQTPLPESVVHFQTRRLEIESPHDLAWTLDGEYGGAVRHAEIEAIPGAFSVLTAEE